MKSWMQISGGLLLMISLTGCFGRNLRVLVVEEGEDPGIDPVPQIMSNEAQPIYYKIQDQEEPVVTKKRLGQCVPVPKHRYRQLVKEANLWRKAERRQNLNEQ